MSLNRPVYENDQADGSRRYRAFVVCPDGYVLNTLTFSAFGDDSASAIAEGMVDGHAIELWDGVRFIERFDPVRD